jgi:WD40 repeat protein
VLHTLPDHGASVTSVRFSRDGRLVATGDRDGKVRIWDAAQGALIHRIDAHSWKKGIVGGATRAAFNPDSSQLLTSAGWRRWRPAIP